MIDSRYQQACVGRAAHDRRASQPALQGAITRTKVEFGKSIPFAMATQTLLFQDRLDCGAEKFLRSVRRAGGTRCSQSQCADEIKPENTTWRAPTDRPQPLAFSHLIPKRMAVVRHPIPVQRCRRQTTEHPASYFSPIVARNMGSRNSNATDGAVGDLRLGTDSGLLSVWRFDVCFPTAPARSSTLRRGRASGTLEGNMRPVTRSGWARTEFRGYAC